MIIEDDICFFPDGNKKVFTKLEYDNPENGTVKVETSGEMYVTKHCRRKYLTHLGQDVFSWGVSPNVATDFSGWSNADEIQKRYGGESCLMLVKATLWRDGSDPRPGSEESVITDPPTHSVK